MTIEEAIKIIFTGLCNGFGTAIGAYLATKHALHLYERNRKKLRRFFK